MQEIEQAWGLGLGYQVSYSLNSPKGGLYRRLYRELLWGLLRGILGV